MARTIKAHEHAQKRNEILDSVQRLVFTKGYERMTIQDILSELQISGGAFYHYFDSKSAVLEAFIERIREETERPFLLILRNPHLTAIGKLQAFLDTLDRLRMDHRADVLKLARVWYTDENALVRQKVDAAILEQRAPVLAEVVQQGVQEGAFTTAYPDLAGEIIMALLQGMGNAHAKLLFSVEQQQNEKSTVEHLVAVYDAYTDAIERVLGAPANSLRRANLEVVETWMTAVKDSAQTISV